MNAEIVFQTLKRDVNMKSYVNFRNVQIHVNLIILLFAILLITSTLALIYYTKTIDHQASIVTSGNIQTYSDADCTQPLDSKNWGNFNTSAGDDVKTLDFYIKNEGNTQINVTWNASGFTLYNETAIEYQTTSWTMYLVLVNGTETTLRPENDTNMSRLTLSPGQAVHLKFYLKAMSGSSPGSLMFQTSFDSRDN